MSNLKNSFYDGKMNLLNESTIVPSKSNKGIPNSFHLIKNNISEKAKMICFASLDILKIGWERLIFLCIIYNPPCITMDMRAASLYHRVPGMSYGGC